MEQHNESKGALIGSIIIILILIVGGIYFAKQAHEINQQGEIDQVLAEDADLQAIQDQEIDQSLDGLEAELDGFDFGTLNESDPDSIEF